MHPRKLWNGIGQFLVMHITHNQENFAVISLHSVSNRHTGSIWKREPKLHLIDAGK